VQHLAGLSTGSEQRVIAERVGVAIGGALLVVPCTSQTVESRSAGCARAGARQVDQRIGGVLDAEPLGQGGRQQ
jgi:hypothetical protein